ncbi:hypothetical protein [Myroides guanonis]|uniref:Uncharacterized protein n=1 Tax=Myroides guanonis TaxID=1150112 RepID=A0A1I3S345_9FLAO|nr:hypothetical protein [Myroides guanonis]SFJ53038.1 hypothetical protein SAMN04487893_109108 [Myroides guanonis]
MKANENRISKVRGSLAFREILQNLVNEGKIIHIFQSNKNLLSHNTLTLFVKNPQVLHEIKYASWVLNSISENSLHIHLFEFNEFIHKNSFQNKVYSSINCQSLHHIYGNKEECSTMFITDFSKGNLRKHCKGTSSWFTTEHLRHYRFLNHIKKEFEEQLIDFDSVMLSLKQLLHEAKTRIQPFFMPNKEMSTQEFISFTFAYCTPIKEVYSGEDESALLNSIVNFDKFIDILVDENGVPIDTYHLIAITRKYVKALYLFINQEYIKRFRETMLNSELEILRASSSVEFINDELERTTKSLLEKRPELNQLFFVARKDISFTDPHNNRIETHLHLLLIGIVDTLSITTEASIRTQIKVATQGKVNITLILLKSTWQKHDSTYHSFFKSHLRLEKQWLGKPHDFKFDNIETVPLQELKSRYWQECDSIIKPIFNRNNHLSELNRSEADIILFKYIVQQLTLAILFFKMDFIPQVYSSKYTWRLLEWYAPEIHQKLENSSNKLSILFEANNFTRNFPKLNYPTEKTNKANWKEIYLFSKALYDYTNTLHQTIPSPTPTIITPTIITPTFIESENTNHVQPILENHEKSNQ